MQKFIVICVAAAFAVAPVTIAATYCTDATMSLQKEEGIYNVVVRVSELIEKDGKVTERLIGEPRIQSSPGVPATLRSGVEPGDPNYSHEENLIVDVSWPYPNESGTAFCTVVIRRGDSIVSKSRLQLKIEGSGRVPLILAVNDVNPDSVKVTEEKSENYVLLEFAGKTRQEVKKLAADNYGNKVQIRDPQGRLTEGGLSFGTYHEIGLTLQCKSENEAKHVASIFRGEGAR
jgi:hypothetical protein